MADCDEWTVIPNHDLRRQKILVKESYLVGADSLPSFIAITHDLRQKKTDDRELLSMGRDRPVVTDMNRSLTKVRDRIMASYLKRWYRLYQYERQPWV